MVGTCTLWAAHTSSCNAGLEYIMAVLLDLLLREFLLTSGIHNDPGLYVTAER